MSNIQAWQWIVAFATPYIIALVNRPTWSASTKRLVMIGVAVVIAFVTHLLSGGFDGMTWGNLLVYLVAFIGVVQAAYALLKITPGAKESLDATEHALVPGEVLERHDEIDEPAGADEVAHALVPDLRTMWPATAYPDEQRVIDYVESWLRGRTD